MASSMIGFVGDVLVDRPNPIEVFRDVRTILAAPSILFANLEGPYTDQPRPVPNAPSWVSSPAHNLDVFAEAGFNVMSMANNHILDAGYEAMLETRTRLRAQGVRTCGAGESLADARRPAILDVNGLRVAFLAYASFFPMGYEARTNRPGLVPMRAYNFWRDSNPAIYAPGRRPLSVSIPDETDLAALTDDVRLAREAADLVVTSFHWGGMGRRFHLTDHEKRTARHCIDQGADIVVGHHHHALRGIEWYNGRPIMYGLGHFVFDLRMDMTEAQYQDSLRLLDPATYYEQNDYAHGPRQGWPLLPMHEDTRMTVFAWATVDRGGVDAVGVLPCRLTPDGLVHPVEHGTSEHDEILRYLGKCNETQSLNGCFVSGDSAPVVAGFPAVRVLPLPSLLSRQDAD